MSMLKANQAQTIAFVLQNSSGVEVTGLGTTFSLSVSKNGGAFAVSSGTKAEIGSGWYSYELTASETDTAGPLAVKVSGTGVDQQNLLYQVSLSGWETPTGTNVLSVEEAAAVLRCDDEDADMLALLPLVDSYLKRATGRDWTLDSTIYPEAKAAARILLTLWHENPAMAGQGISALQYGLPATLTQLEALAQMLETNGTPDYALGLLASMPAAGASGVAVDADLTLVFKNEMSSGATSLVKLYDASGNTVTTVNALDVTKRIMTINPSGDLNAEASYTLSIEDAADIYGQTLDLDIGFRTA